MYIVRWMADTTQDPAVAMFRQIIDFDEMYYLKLPDMNTATDRRQIMLETKNHLISDQFERVSYDSYVTTLDHYKDVFQDTYAHLEEKTTPSTHKQYQHCISMLKLLSGRFRMRILLHDLQQIYKELM
jgi:hypothetical protein